MRRQSLLITLFALCTILPLSAQEELKTSVVKHLKTSRDFSVKVAEAMPEANYTFKLTPPQMSFGQQLVHLSQDLGYFLSAFSGQKFVPAKPKSDGKDDVIAFIKSSYNEAISKVNALTAEQISKTYKSSEGSGTGIDLLLGMLDHCTHHRASAEMYLRAKGITPPEYQF